MMVWQNGFTSIKRVTQHLNEQKKLDKLSKGMNKQKYLDVVHLQINGATSNWETALGEP